MASIIPFTSKMTAAYNKAYASIENEDIDERFDSLEKFVKEDKHSELSDEEKKEVIQRFKYDRDYFKVLFNKGRTTKCNKCNSENRLASLYCELCVREYLRKCLNNSNWNSGNNAINNLISECQKETIVPYMVVEWIPFKDIKDIKPLEKQYVSGKEGTEATKVLAEAKWKGKEGSYYCEWDSENKILKRNKDECKVVLKKLVGNVDEWVREVREHLNINNKWGCVVRCYGLTRDELGNYMLVMMKMDFNLEEYLKRFDRLTSREVVKASFETIKALSRIHAENYPHVNLHFRNILYLKEKGDWYIDASSYKFKKDDILKFGQLFDSLIFVEEESQRKAKKDTSYYADYKKLISSCLEKSPEKRPNIDELWKSMEKIDRLTHGEQSY